MNVLLLLVPLSLVLVGVAAWAFAWAVRRGQFDDLDTPALDVLRDDRNDRDIPQDIVGPRDSALQTPQGHHPAADAGMAAANPDPDGLAPGERPHAD